MKKWHLFGLLILALAALPGCGSDGEGELPVYDPNKNQLSVVDLENPTAKAIEILADKYTVKADGTDTATLTIFVRDFGNAALRDAKVFLTCDQGLLSASNVTTDVDGEAEFTFRAGGSKTNATANITAITGLNSATGQVQATLPIDITGSTVTLTTEKNATRPYDGRTAETKAATSVKMTASAIDISDIPVNNTPLTFTSEKGNKFAVVTSTGTQPGAVNPLTVNTNTSGEVKVEFQATVIGTDKITLSGLGTTKTVEINVTNESFGFTDPANNTTLPINGSQVLTVTYTDEGGVAQTGTQLAYAASGGSLDKATGAISPTGTDTLVFTANSTPGPVTIDVQTVGLTDTGGNPITLKSNITLMVQSQIPARIDLQASPTILPVAIAGAAPTTSTLTATVRDANNNAVQGALVTFTLLQGPGGGERIDPATVSVITDISGIAKSSFIPGGQNSAQNGVTIQASVRNGATTFTDQINLTIAAQATSLIFGTSNKITKVSEGGFEVGYEFPVMVSVTDSNGNPVAGKVVSLGVYPYIFYTGLRTHPGLYTGAFLNEDANRNGILDPGEDGATGSYEFTPGVLSAARLIAPGGEGIPADIVRVADFPLASGRLDGILQPKGIVTIPGTVTTNSDGRAVFGVSYAKSYANWAQIEIKATTGVTGSETSATINLPLPAPEGDEPYLHSPFGY